MTASARLRELQAEGDPWAVFNITGVIADVVEAAEKDDDLGDTDDATSAALTALRDALEKK